VLEETLRGYRVLDLSQYLPGPYAGRLLADLGAEVVKVEPPGGDPMRTFLYRGGDALSPFYRQLNAGKTVIRLDLKNPADRSCFTGLVESADVLLESFRPGVMARLGFDRDHLAGLSPRLVHCAISGYGQDGPAGQRAGHDLNYLALSGMLSHTGTRDTPVIPFPPVSDYAAGLHAANLVLAALLRRERRGPGCFIDASLFETALSWQSFGQAAAKVPGLSLEPGLGLITGGAACYQIYRTSDGKFVVLGALEEKFWQAFCAAVGRPDWRSRQAEALPQTDLIREVAAMFARAPRDTWVGLLAEADCCFEPLLAPDEVGGHPQVLARQLIEPAQAEGHPPDIRFPVLVNGQASSRRVPLREEQAPAVLARWQRV
jgi:crotonobetainyl-CoA:carnitine CoA-transferase CaiB-like acyl-CoA transferase